MPIISIPLTHGQNESIDAKLLPHGMLKAATNIRFRKDGRMGSRNGYDFITGSVSGAIAAGNFGQNRSVYVKDRVSDAVPATWWQRGQDGTFSTPVQASCVGSMGAPRRYAIGRNAQYQAVSCDSAYANGVILYAWHDNDAAGNNNDIQVTIVEAKSQRTIYSNVVVGEVPRVLAIGTNIYLFTSNSATGAITQRVYDCSAAPGAVTLSATNAVAGGLYAPSAAFPRYWDVCVVSSSLFALIYYEGANTLRWGTVSLAGAFVGKNIVNTLAAAGRPSITLGSTSGNVAFVWAENATHVAGNVYYAEMPVAGGTVTARTVIDASGNCHGYPVAGPSTLYDYVFSWVSPNGGAAPLSMQVLFPKSGDPVQSIHNVAPVTKPFELLGGNFIVAASYVDSASGLATYKVVDLNAVRNINSGSVMMETLLAPHEAMTGAASVSASIFDVRRNVYSVPDLYGQLGQTALMFCAPVVVGVNYGMDAFRVEQGPNEPRWLPANINGQLIFSGGRIREFDGSKLVESGLADGPEYVSVTSLAGAIPAGTYQYSCVWEWFDGMGRRHQSPPSTPVSITTGIASNITVATARPSFTDKYTSTGSGSITNQTKAVHLRVYRTLNAGTIFYLVNTTAAPDADATPYNPVFIIDTSLDATIQSHETLYTQGARGGLSGLLPNDEPPPASFIWAGNDRVILGGLEDRSAVQWSKLIFPGEPTQYSLSKQFRANVDADVTSVAALDGTWYVFTRDSVWSVTGDGPDDTGAGEFSSPRRLPADVGCISHRSMVETPLGLMYQGRADRIYLLPRGGGAPVWIGQAVRDTLLAFPNILWARMLPDDSTVMWAISSTSGSLGRLLIFDTRIQEWSVDDPYGRKTSCLDVYGGQVVLDGFMQESALWEDDDTGSKHDPITMRIETGDIRPFGAGGWGRCKMLYLLGERRSSSATDNVTISCSTSSGPVDAVGSWALTPIGVGGVLELEECPPVIRGSSFRFIVQNTPSVPDEGIVLNAVSLEVYPGEGSPRLAAAQRG